MEIWEKEEIDPRKEWKKERKKACLYRYFYISSAAIRHILKPFEQYDHPKNFSNIFDINILCKTFIRRTVMQIENSKNVCPKNNWMCNWFPWIVASVLWMVGCSEWLLMYIVAFFNGWLLWMVTSMDGLLVWRYIDLKNPAIWLVETFFGHILTYQTTSI